MLSPGESVYTQFKSAKGITSDVSNSIYSRSFWLMMPLDPGLKEMLASKPVLPNLVETSYLTLEMWLVGIGMCLKYKIYTRF